MHRIAFALALASSCLTPVAARAQDTPAEKSEVATPPAEASPTAEEATAPTDQAPLMMNEFTLGVQWVGGKNTGLFGRYNGLTYEGLDVIGGFRIRHRDPGDSGKTFYYDVSGTNLVLQTGRR